VVETGARQEQARIEPENLVPGQRELPGVKDSTILVMDSALTLLRLFKAEAAFALGAIPALLNLNLYRAPAYLLTWISFGVFAACGVHALTASLLFSAGTFFLLQLALTLVLERRMRRLHERMDFPESRQGFDVFQAALKERFKHEQAS
jgi:hypothetical protein